MKRHLQLAMLCALGISSLLSCVDQHASSANKEKNQDTLHYDMQEVHEFSKFFLKEGEQIDTTYFKARYPTFSDTAMNNLLHASIYLDGDSSMTTAAKRFIDTYDEYLEDNNGLSTATWFRDFDVKVFQNTAKFISIETNQSDYTGGAHGDHFTLFSHYDRATDQKIMLNDIIKVENQKEFIKIAERNFRKLENLSRSDSLNDKFFFENGHFSLANNFALTRNELLFFYNVYEIKSYADGVTELKVPYEQVKHLISNKGLEYINSIN